MSSEMGIDPFGQAQELANVLRCILRMETSHSSSSTLPSEAFTSLDPCALTSQEQLEKYMNELAPIVNLVNSASSLDSSQRQEAMKFAADIILARRGVGMGWAHALSDRLVASIQEETNEYLVPETLPEFQPSEFLSLDNYSSCTEAESPEMIELQIDEEISTILSANSEHRSSAGSLEVLLPSSSMVDSSSELVEDDGACVSAAKNVLSRLEDNRGCACPEKNNLSRLVISSSSGMSQDSSVLTPDSSVSWTKDSYYKNPEFVHCSDSSKSLEEISYGGSEAAASLQGTQKKQKCSYSYSMGTSALENVSPQMSYVPYSINHPSVFTSMGSNVDPYTTCYSSLDKTASMKEMIYQMAAFQPVNLGTEGINRPRRKNVRISKDPQSVAARHRRERISNRIGILQKLVPGGTKMDTASMLDEAAHYIKFLKMQVQALDTLSSKLGCWSMPNVHPASLSMDRPNICTETSEMKQQSCH